MTLWGNIDTASGNQKPVFANTTNVTSSSTIHGKAANTNTYYGQVYGVSATEAANNTGHGKKVVHAGWVSQKIGTGPIKSIGWSGGTGYNAAGYLRFTDGSVLGDGTGANASFTIANTLNVMQSYSTNAQWNVINSITVNDGGSLYSNSTLIAVAGPAAISNATFTIVLGGRGDRTNYETLVAMGSMVGDDDNDNVFFPGT